MKTNFKTKKTATSEDLRRGYKTGEKFTKDDFLKAKEKESINLRRQFGMDDKRNWY